MSTMNGSGIVMIGIFALLMVAGLAVSENNDTLKDSGTSKADAPKSIELPEPRTDKGILVEDALKERRSIRTFGRNGLTLDEASQLLWAAQGVTDDRGHRTAPSAMAIYPLQVYLIAGNISGLPTGVYRYSPPGHSLTVMAQGRVDEYYDAAAGPENWIKTAPAIFVITGNLDSMNRIPGSQLAAKETSPWVYVEAGAAAENLLLEVVSLGLASTYTAGFNPNKLEELMLLPSGEVPIGVLPVGRKA